VEELPKFINNAMSGKENKYDLTTFSSFFQENHQKFLSFTYSYIRNYDDAEDILMDAVASLWENRDKWNEDSNMFALLLTIIKNKSLNYLSREQTRLRIEDDITSHQKRELNLRVSSLKVCNPDMIFRTEVHQIVRKSLEKLPKQSRQVFVLSRFKYLTNKQIAEKLGVSIKTVEFHMTKVLKILRNDLKDYLVLFFFITMI